MKILLILATILGLWFVPSWAQAATITAASCEYAAVNAAVYGPAPGPVAEGDTIQIPGGTCIWTTTLNLNATGKSFTIQGIGAGTKVQCADASQSTPTAAYTCISQGATPQAQLIIWATIPTGYPRITAMTFDSGTGANTNDEHYAVLHIGGNSGNFRLDHTNVYAHRNGEPTFSTNGNLRGVLDHNIFDCTGPTSNGTNCLFIQHPFWGGGVNTCPSLGIGCGDASWAAATGFGSANWLFIEDNVITNRPTFRFCSDGWKGGRYVWRFNTQINCASGNHGTDSAGRSRGGRAIEYYGNTCSFLTSAFPACHGIRGGGMIAFGNRCTALCTRVVEISHYRVQVNYAQNQCSFWGCADTFSGTDGVGGCCNTFDFGTGTANGYPAMDQTARGQGDLITGNDSDKASLVVGGSLDCHIPNPDACWPHQVIEPVYAWNNDLAGVNSPVNRSAGPIAYLTEQRDYYTERHTSGSNNFNGTTGTIGTTSGIGIGTKIQMNASPCVSAPDPAGTASVTGQAWWVTDEGTWATGTDSTGVNHDGFDGQLYKCTDGTNPNPALRWTLYYTPYTYPHPLVGPPDIIPPASPTGFTVSKLERK